MRPDVAQAFDRMARAARADGVSLVISSAFRSDAEQAVLFARHPDPKWVAPPGESLHRNATELDLGPRSAYPGSPRTPGASTSGSGTNGRTGTRGYP
jgi:LAS superfamily LD-carboxypeptidase LdcB